MNRGKSPKDSVILGSAPRVHLLPPEVEAKQRSRAMRRYLLLGLVGVIAILVAGVGIATLGLLASNSALAAEHARTAGLAVEQGKYGKVLSVQNQVSDIGTARILGTTSEIDWQAYVAALQKTLPANTTVLSFHAVLASVGATAAETPLQGPRIATLTISADSPKASVSDWLDALAGLKGFVDATPGSVQLNAATGRYTVQVEMHINKDALANRFLKGTK